MLYELFGVSLDSDLPLPLSLSTKTDVDVRIILGRVAPQGALIWKSAPDQPPFACYQGADDETIVLSWSAGRFAVAPTCVIVEPASEGEIIPLLLQPVWSFVLAARQRETLHGSAVAHQGKAIAVLGASGTGKSTAAARLIERGWCLATDDLLVVDATGHVLVGPPFLRLAGNRTSDQMRDAGDDGKIYLPVLSCTAPALLVAVVVLDEQYRRWDRLRGAAAVGTLLKHVYNPIGHTQGQALRRLDLVSRIVETVPIYGTPPRSLTPEILDALAHEVADALSYTEPH